MQTVKDAHATSYDLVELNNIICDLELHPTVNPDNNKSITTI